MGKYKTGYKKVHTQLYYYVKVNKAPVRKCSPEIVL